MLNHLIKGEAKGFFIVAIFIGLLAVSFSIFKGNVILDDPFHYGEFFAATVGLFGDVNYSFHPLTIHGALDFVPALIAENYWDSDSYFLPTFAIYKALNFLAALFLILISHELTKSKPYQWLLLLAVAAASPLLVNGRDLFLLISLYLFFQIDDRDVKHGLGIFLQMLFGITVAFGLFWSYDRGIAGSLSLGIAVLVLFLRNRWYAISLMSFLATVASLSLVFKVFSINNYLNDVYILMETSGNWSYGWKKLPIQLTLFGLIFNMAAILFLFVENKKSKYVIKKLPVILCLFFLSIFMLKIGINRADILHIYWTLWMPMLIGLYLYGKNISIKVVGNILIIFVFFVAIVLTIMLKAYGLVLVVGIFAFTNLIYKNEINFYK